MDLNCASTAVSNVRVESNRRLIGWSANIIGGECENLPDTIVVTEKPDTGCVATSQLQILFNHVQTACQRAMVLIQDGDLSRAAALLTVITQDVGRCASAQQ